MLATRPATDIFFGPPTKLDFTDFESKHFTVRSDFRAQVFRSNSAMTTDQILLVLDNLLREQRRLKLEAKTRAKTERCMLKPKRKRRPASKKPKWHEMVDKKRQLIASVLRRHPNPSLAEVCRFTGCAYSTVKKVLLDLEYQGTPSPFKYQNLKSTYTLERLASSIAEVQGSFMTVSDLRRAHPDCSKRLIRRHLHQAGLRYHKLQKNRKHPKAKKTDSQRILRTVSHITQAISTRQANILYIDEVHFPLFQTAEKHWTDPSCPEQPVYNRRPTAEDVKLSVIAACSLQRFEAAQVFRHDVTKEDFLYFLQELVARQPRGQSLTVLADNASWHTSPVVTETAAGEFLYFNAQGVFRANAIENAFSFVRAEFRKRPTFSTLEDEAFMLLEIFFQEENVERFKGIHRNHLRSLTRLLLDNDPTLADSHLRVLD